jgi:copper chaperone
MTKQNISVPDISCNHCKMSIEGAVGALSGVEKVEVHIEPRTVDVDFDDASVSLDAIYAAIEEQGYEVAKG